MKNIIKTFGLLSVFAIIPASFAATSRVSMVSKASPRLPSIAGYIMANSAANGTLNTGVNGTATSYLADPDCISNYTDCIKGNDACGSNFEDCTNSILLHAKMPNCLSVLAQCSAAGRTSLFGTADLNAIATAATTNSNGEVTAYTYPLAGSALGQMVTAAQIDNQLSADKCVKNYTSCLRKDNVCGYDFELCTDNKEFKKQALTCASTLARCQSDGKTELFGSVAEANGLKPAAGSRLAELITEGAALAVNNAVATCNKVTDQCILNACTKNPNKCIEGRPEILIRIADATNGGKAVTTQDLMEITKNTEKREISDYIRQECQQTIGSNKYCYMTVMGKPVTKESVLTNPDNVSEVFEDMYNGEFGRFAALNDKITQIADNFDAKVQDKCIDTISSCAMRSCGGGIGSLCYKQSRDENGGVDISKTEKSYNEVKSACRAIVDVDANCQYAAVLSQGSLYAGYMDDTNSVFTTLYPQKVSATTPDPIGVIATLNATLAQSYNDAAIENMRKQCQTVALSCVKSMCGKDYENCYRNRTDIVAGTYNTGTKLDRSMNKMGGVIDYNIVIGLCMNTVKDSSVCNEHLKIAINDLTDDKASWGDDKTVRTAWKGANDADKVHTTATSSDVVVACRPADDNPDVKGKCPISLRWEVSEDSTCPGEMDEDGCVYNTPVTQNVTDYKIEHAGTTLFQELLADVEREAQAKYNAKLTKEQNTCLAQNNGGIMGANDNGSTFMWVKLHGNKIPKTYNTKGLTSKQFVASNDLYGSFCRARITVTSDDKDIQSVLSKEGATAYFAVGDAFTCGSWIDDKTMAKISEKVGQRKLCEEGYGVWDTTTGECSGTSTKEKIAYAWGTVAPALAAGGIGIGLTEGGVLSKWMKSANEKNGISSETVEKWGERCKQAAGAAQTATTPEEANIYAAQAYTACSNLDVPKSEGCDKITASSTVDDTFRNKMKALASSCKNYESYADNGQRGKSQKAARIAIPIVTTVAGGALGAGITASVIQAKKEEIKNKAVAEWMEEIGEHIQCYLGADELGSYGDVVSFTIE